ncbi:hypothetical protein MKX08_008444 [Trichoderma sp. CBMAI-0020]|nr:hypothetical protein MKX08_008444 [Trichoderma sp. CBMAI-0020]
MQDPASVCPIQQYGQGAAGSSDSTDEAPSTAKNAAQAGRARNQISNFTSTLTMAAETCSKPSNFGRGAYDTTGLPKPPPPQPQ